MAAVLCNYLSKILADCSSCLSYPCQECCKCTSRMLCSPFTPYLIVTLSFNTTLIVWGYEIFKRNSIFCDKAWWVLVNALLGLCHIIGAVYVVYRIQRDRVPTKEMEHEYNETLDPENQDCHLPSAQNGRKMGAYVNQPNNASGGKEDGKRDLTSPRTTPSGRAAIYLKAKEKLRSPTSSTLPAPSVNMNEQNDEYVLMKEKHAGSNTNKNKPLSPAFFPDKSRDHDIRSSPKGADVQIESVASLLAGLPEAPDDGPANSPQRLGRVLCFDSGVAFYFFLVALWVIWQSVGVLCAMSLAGNIEYNENDHCDNITRWIVLSTMCGFLYIILVFFAFGCSLLCLR